MNVKLKYITDRKTTTYFNTFLNDLFTTRCQAPMPNCLFFRPGMKFINWLSYYNVKTRLVDLVGLCWLQKKSVENSFGWVLIIDSDDFFLIEVC